MAGGKLGFRSMYDCEVTGRRVLIRVDINSPLDPQTKQIVNRNRLEKTVPTLAWLHKEGAQTAIIAHQGDTDDYQNLIPLQEHAEILSDLLGTPVRYIDDVCGPMAQSAVEALDNGELVLLGNLRYLSEEMSSFEKVVPLEPEQMQQTWLVRSLSPLFDLYINEAFSAAHRKSPSMVAFQEVLPSAAGPLFFNELQALTQVMKSPVPPSVFVLGGARIGDAFGMMQAVLENGTADRILTCGVTGEVFLMASGIELGEQVTGFLKSKSLDGYVAEAKTYLERYPGKIWIPIDLAYAAQGQRKEVEIAPVMESEMYLDIGAMTTALYQKEIKKAGTVFVNGPAGMYEDSLFEAGTKGLWQTIAGSSAYTVVGGGDSVSAAAKYTKPEDWSYICTAGGAMVRFLSGKKLALVHAMEKAGLRDI